MKNKKSFIFISIGIILITIAISLIIYNNYVDKRAGEKSKEILELIENKIEDSEIAKQDTILVNNNEYIGIIDIPTIDIKLPIISSWSYENLKTSPSVYHGSIETEDLVICAHAYKSLFRYIKDLNKGDKVVITTVTNKQYIYEVEVIEVLSPTDVKEMIESEFALTLFTCTNDNKNRVTVRLNLYEE